LGTASGIGIGIGIGIVIGIAVTMSFVAINQGTITIEDIPVLDFDKDPQLAYLQATYQYANDELKLVLLLTDSNAEYTRADGTLEITVQKDGSRVYSTQHEITKDSFVTWKDASGEKVTGAMVVINQYFRSGSHDVFVNFNSDAGYWEEIHTTFYSLE